MPDPKKSRKGAFVAVVMLLFGIGFGVWWTFLRSSPVNSADQPQSVSVRTVLPMESFTVNLADQEEGRFLRTTLSLGVDGQVPVLTRGENKAVETGPISMAIIRDSILAVLTQRKSGDLLTPDGKAKLKTDLINALNRDVPALQAREVYFTEFLVQR